MTTGREDVTVGEKSETAAIMESIIGGDGERRMTTKNGDDDDNDNDDEWCSAIWFGFHSAKVRLEDLI